MSYYTYKNTLRVLFINKLNFFSNNHIVPALDFMNVFVSLKDIMSYDEYRVWQALFLINFFTGSKGRVISRGYRSKGSEMLYSVEISVTLRGDTAYEFLYFLFAYVFPGVDDAGIYESEFGGGKKGKAALFFSMPETMDIDFLESSSEIVGWNSPFNVSIFLSSLTDCSLFVFLLSSLKFLSEEEEDEESFSCEW